MVVVSHLFFWFSIIFSLNLQLYNNFCKFPVNFITFLYFYFNILYIFGMTFCLLNYLDTKPGDGGLEVQKKKLTRISNVF